MPIEFHRDGPWDLPEGWVWARLGDACQINQQPSFVDLPDDLEIPFVPMAAVAEETGAVDFSQRKRISELRSGYTRFRSGDVLFAKITPCMENGKSAALIDIPGGFGAGSTEFHTFRSPVLEPRYLWYWLVRKAFRADAQQNMRGAVGQLRVPLDYLSNTQIAIPPLAEQRRIVARIDELFTEIADGEAALARARADLDTWRRALLKAAVTGELTREWREERAISADWIWTTIGEAGQLRLGRQRSPEHHHGDHMRPYLRVANVFEDRLDLTDVKSMNFTPQEFETYRLKNNDILLNEGQSPDLLGRPAIFKGEIDGCCFQNTLLRFRAGEGLLPQFALLVFRHYMRSGRFKKEARITTNLAHLSQSRCASIEFPLPSTAEQAHISDTVRELEEEAAEQFAVMNSSDLTRLRQTILKVAFEGRLVEQNPSDEPAERLLVRLNKQREAQGLSSTRKTRRAAINAAE